MKGDYSCTGNPSVGGCVGIEAGLDVLPARVGSFFGMLIYCLMHSSSWFCFLVVYPPLFSLPPSLPPYPTAIIPYPPIFSHPLLPNTFHQSITPSIQHPTPHHDNQSNSFLPDNLAYTPRKSIFQQRRNSTQTRYLVRIQPTYLGAKLLSVCLSVCLGVCHRIRLCFPYLTFPDLQSVPPPDHLKAPSPRTPPKPTRYQPPHLLFVRPFLTLYTSTLVLPCL